MCCHPAVNLRPWPSPERLCSPPLLGAVADSFPLPVESLKVVNTLIFPSLRGLSVTSLGAEFIVCELIFLCSG